MKYLQYFIFCTMFLVLGCDDKPDKCNNLCGDRAVCDDNGICQPKTSGDFYNPKTGKYEHIFNIGFETFRNCAFYNYSYVDTPWIMPSFMNIDKNGINLNTLTLDSLRDLFYDKNVTHSDLTFNRDLSGKVIDFNIVYVSDFDNILFDFNLQKKYAKKTVVNSWVGKVSADRKRIDFTIYFYVNRSTLLYEDSDTVKIINRSYTVHPECKSDCRFCYGCE
jgi:hypothetical protein